MPQEFKLNVGDKIPFFQLQDDQRREVSSDAIFGRPAIIYFYPKDNTEGCTAEACSFRDALEQFDQLKVMVLGISPDSVESHQKFKKDFGLNFRLLSDSDHKTCEDFDVWKEKNMYGNKYFGVLRTTFMVDGDGIIRWIERPVKVEGHVERLLRALRTYTDLTPHE
jgi:peroxiredoxin Q/BCP